MMSWWDAEREGSLDKVYLAEDKLRKANKEADVREDIGLS